MNNITSYSADYQTFPTLFKLEPVAGKKVTVDFSAPELSSLGELSLVREYEKSSNSIIERIEPCIKDPRREPMVVHSQMEMLRQRIYQIMAGFEDADDTNADTYGAQQLTLFNAYHGEYCYMPLLLFEGRSGTSSDLVRATRQSTFHADMLMGTELECSTLTTMREKLLLSAILCLLDIFRRCFRAHRTAFIRKTMQCQGNAGQSDSYCEDKAWWR